MDDAKGQSSDDLALADHRLFLHILNWEYEILRLYHLHKWEDNFKPYVSLLLVDHFRRYRRAHRLRLNRLPRTRALLNYSSPNFIRSYPLADSHFCIKGLWFPILSSLVKESFRKQRDEQKMASEPKSKPKTEAEQLGLKVCLTCTQSLFENRQTLPERTFDKVMDTTKKILGRSQRDPSVRLVTFSFTGEAS